jgi:hypothetical protein
MLLTLSISNKVDKFLQYSLICAHPRKNLRKSAGNNSALQTDSAFRRVFPQIFADFDADFRRFFS